MPAPLSLSLLANKPTALPDTVLAKVVIPAGYSYTTGIGGSPINLAASAIADPQLQGGACGPNFQLPVDVDVHAWPCRCFWMLPQQRRVDICS